MSLHTFIISLPAHSWVRFSIEQTQYEVHGDFGEPVSAEVYLVLPAPTPLNKGYTGTVELPGTQCQQIEFRSMFTSTLAVGHAGLLDQSTKYPGRTKVLRIRTPYPLQDYFLSVDKVFSPSLFYRLPGYEIRGK